MKLTVNIDMDGVIYDFNGAMTSLGEVYLGRKLPVTESWEMWDAWGVSRDEWYEMFHEAILDDEVFRIGHEIPGAVQAVRSLTKKHRVRIVTSKKLRFPRSTQAAQIQTIRWLGEAGLLNHVELAFAGDKQGYTADVVIDDKPTLKWAQRGAMNLLFAQPWNQDVPEEAFFGQPSLTLVESWDDVLHHVEELSHVEALRAELSRHRDAGRGGF